MKSFFKMRVWYNGTFLSQVKHLSEAKMVDFVLVHLINKDTMEFHVNKEIRTRIATGVGISEPSVNRCLNSLKSSGILESTGRGLYKFNDDYITYGKD